MSGAPDFYGMALATGVFALFAWFFWHTAASWLKGSKVLSAYLDTRALRERAELEREEQFGPHSFWLRAARKLVLAILFAGSAFLVWNLIQG